MLWQEFERAYEQATAGSAPDLNLSAAQWAAITSAYAGTEFDKIEGCNGEKRHRIFADWVLYGAGKPVYEAFLQDEYTRRNALRARATDLRAQAYLLDLEAES
jgi:hypothetical protein